MAGGAAGDVVLKSERLVEPGTGSGADLRHSRPMPNPVPNAWHCQRPTSPGKSYLLQALAEVTRGLYFAATEATEAESLRLFSEALVR